MNLNYQQIQTILADKAEYLLNYQSNTFDKEIFTFPSPNSVQSVFSQSDRNQKVIDNLNRLYNTGNLAGTGYICILPVDQGVEHSAGASFAKNPAYFDPENLVKLALEGGCSGFASTLGATSIVAKKYAHKIPLIVKINHNELLTYPNKAEQIIFGQVQQAFDMGAVAIGATIYFGSADSGRQIVEISQAFYQAHQLGLATILWCYLRNDAFKKDGVDYHFSADLTGQANHLGVSLGADIIKQKLPTNNGGYKALNTESSSYGKIDQRIYSQLTTNHPIDLTRYQVANCYLGKIPLINSGGASLNSDSEQETQKADLKEAIRTAVINKRAGGSGLILGRKAFQKSFNDGVEILHAIQSVYTCPQITLA